MRPPCCSRPADAPRRPRSCRGRSRRPRAASRWRDARGTGREVQHREQRRVPGGSCSSFPIGAPQHDDDVLLDRRRRSSTMRTAGRSPCSRRRGSPCRCRSPCSTNTSHPRSASRAINDGRKSRRSPGSLCIRGKPNVIRATRRPPSRHLRSGDGRSIVRRAVRGPRPRPGCRGPRQHAARVARRTSACSPGVEPGPGVAGQREPAVRRVDPRIASQVGIVLGGNTYRSSEPCGTPSIPFTTGGVAVEVVRDHTRGRGCTPSTGSAASHAFGITGRLGSARLRRVDQEVGRARVVPSM